MVNNKKQYESWQLIAWLKDFADELGKTPTLQEINNEPSMPSQHIYSEADYFEFYSKACREAGLEVNHREYSKKEVINMLKKYCENLGRAPTIKELQKNKEIPSYGTYRRYFGTWGNALKRAGYNLERDKNYSKEELIEKLRNFAEKIGRTPTQIEVNRNEKMPSSSVYQSRFGNYSDACREAGLIPFEKGTNLNHLPQEEIKKRMV